LTYFSNVFDDTLPLYLLGSNDLHFACHVRSILLVINRINLLEVFNLGETGETGRT